MMISNHRNSKSNEKMMKTIHDSNELNDQILETIKKCYEASDHKSTAQDNLLWESIMILARKIHDLEDNNYVK
ncbi:hypothetical protein EJK17_00535 [Lactobacillus xujianguonis]|uniref:Uncharacterized protein n=2 Tax=Lactobacillus xujianguonis TaxID=2495899 RepID=A0A437SY66_9LACO|nr:hypothetical protein EJK17_00535 [Lactobacillus xujianguonis]